jgi:acetolactate synthase-1/2/3 large subunit
MGLRCAYQERIPMVVCAGETITFGEDDGVADPGGQWLHDLCDLGGPADLLRRCVKWSERISSPSILIPDLMRALQIAQEPPAGPVLLGIPVELLMGDIRLPEGGRRNEAVRGVELEGAAIQKAVELMVTAKAPIVVTENVGRDVNAVKHLTELCELLSIPVMESFRPAFLNFPRNHSLYLPYDRAYLESADLILVVGAVSPWYPAGRGPKGNSRVLLIDDEFPHSRLPFWGYDVDMALVAPPAVTLGRLVKDVRASRKINANRALHEERRVRAQQEHARQENDLREQAETHANEAPIDPRWLCNVLNQVIPPEAIIVEETTVHRTLIQRMILRSQPMSYFARVTGGLGVGLGYGLGVKLARQDSPVFMLLGDGALHYNPVAACLGLAQEYSIPICIVLFNNQRYLSQERSLLKYFPEGAAKKTGVHYGVAIEPNPDYRLLASTYGGYGVKVEKPDQIRPAVEQAMAEMAQGKLSLIDVVLSDFTPR